MPERKHSFFQEVFPNTELIIIIRSGGHTRPGTVVLEGSAGIGGLSTAVTLLGSNQLLVKCAINILVPMGW